MPSYPLVSMSFVQFGLRKVWGWCLYWHPAKFSRWEQLASRFWSASAAFLTTPPCLSNPGRMFKEPFSLAPSWPPFYILWPYLLGLRGPSLCPAPPENAHPRAVIHSAFPTSWLSNYSRGEFQLCFSAGVVLLMNINIKQWLKSSKNWISF